MTTPVRSMLDQMPFRFPCGHTVVVGRLEDLTTWVCEGGYCAEPHRPKENCGINYDLSTGDLKQRLAEDLAIAIQQDLQEAAKGLAVIRDRK